MDTATVLAERHQLIKDSIRFKPVKRIPTMSNAWTWQIVDSDLNVTIEQCNDDWDLMEKVNREHIERYNFDIYMCPGTRNANAVSKALGANQHMIKGNFIQALDLHLINTPEDYRAYMADPTMYAWTKVGPERFEGLTLGQIETAIVELGKYFGYIGKIENICAEEYGVITPNPNRCGQPLETYIDTMRGLRGFAIDMRRHPDLLDELVEYHLPAFKASVDRALSFDENVRYFSDVCHGFLGHSIMNLKQFEKYFMPFTSYLLGECVKKDKTAFIMWEADAIRFADLFNDYPKGTIIALMEQEDLLDIRAAMPNLGMIGGVRSTTLHGGTPQQCVDEAKRLVEGLGTGFILSQNKMLTYASDCDRENLLAVQEYANSMVL